jgi:hypothetical protein
MKEKIIQKILLSSDDLTKSDLKEMLFENEEALLDRLFQILDFYIEEYNR